MAPAEELHVSTAQVSQTIRKLERRIGVPLFTRTSRRVELTPVGRRLRDDLGPAWSPVRCCAGAALPRRRGGDAGPRPRAGLQELPNLAGAGEGVLPVGAHIRRCYPRPDVAYVPFSDAPLPE